MIAALEWQGLAGDTIIVLAGDNGLALGQHGLMGKQNLYEHSVRVPLLMSGPGIPKGERRDSLCYLLDIFPTLCDLTGLPVPGSVEGRSLVPVLRDPEAVVRESLYLAYSSLQRGVKDRSHKLLEYVVEGERMTQLFDLARDPWEQENLAGRPGQGTLVSAAARRARAAEGRVGRPRDGVGLGLLAGLREPGRRGRALDDQVAAARPPRGPGGTGGPRSPSSATWQAARWSRPRGTFP